MQQHAKQSSENDDYWFIPALESHNAWLCYGLPKWPKAWETEEKDEIIEKVGFCTIWTSKSKHIFIFYEFMTGLEYCTSGQYLCPSVRRLMGIFRACREVGVTFYTLNTQVIISNFVISQSMFTKLNLCSVFC